MENIFSLNTVNLYLNMHVILLDHKMCQYQSLLFVLIHELIDACYYDLNVLQTDDVKRNVEILIALDDVLALLYIQNNKHASK